MFETSAPLKAIVKQRLEKRHEGELFEVIEGADGLPTVVTFRKPGVAPHESYAWDLPLAETAAQASEPAVRVVTAIDSATVGATDARQ